MVLLGALAGVVAGAGVGELKRPVGGLQRQQLSERAQVGGRAEGAQLGAALAPGELAVPGAQVAAGAPARGWNVDGGARLRDVERLDRAVLEQRLEERDPLVPEVPEE